MKEKKKTKERWDSRWEGIIHGPALMTGFACTAHTWDSFTAEDNELGTYGTMSDCGLFSAREWLAGLTKITTRSNTYLYIYFPFFGLFLPSY